MKILYHHRTQAEDGQAVHIRSLIRAFREEGHQVREVGLVEQAASGAGEQTAGLEQQRSRWGLAGRLPRHLLELAEYGYSLAGRAKVLRGAAEERPDFIYERYAFGNAGGVQAAAKLDLPLFLEVNSPMVHELGKTRGLAFPRLAARIENSVFRRATRVVVVTQVLGDMLIELGVDPQRLLVTPNGVHLDDYRDASSAAAASNARLALGLPAEVDGPVLGFTGYYRTWHRLDLAVRALGEPGLERARLVLVGEGPAEDELRAAAQGAGVSDRVVFAGRCQHDAIPGLLPAFDIALVPAINAYASPLKLQEYMAAGLAILAPDQPNLREVLTHGRDALLVEPGSPTAFAEALLELVRDPERSAALGAAARATVERDELTWRGNARRVLAAYGDLRA